VDEFGKLIIDSTELNEALNNDLDAVEALFIRSGQTNNSEVSFSSATPDPVIGNYPVNITTAAQQANVTGSQTLGAGGPGGQ
jgi:flagellar capping protein FliD